MDAGPAPPPGPSTAMEYYPQPPAASGVQQEESSGPMEGGSFDSSRPQGGSEEYAQDGASGGVPMVAACRACRSAKVKCDKQHPCSRCRKFNLECTPQERGRGRPKVKRPGDGGVDPSSSESTLMMHHHHSSKPGSSSSLESSGSMSRMLSSRPGGMPSSPDQHRRRRPKRPDEGMMDDDGDDEDGLLPPAKRKGRRPLTGPSSSLPGSSHLHHLQGGGAPQPMRFPIANEPSTRVGLYKTPAEMAQEVDALIGPSSTSLVLPHKRSQYLTDLSDNPFFRDARDMAFTHMMVSEFAKLHRQNRLDLRKAMASLRANAMAVLRSGDERVRAMVELMGTIIGVEWKELLEDAEVKELALLREGGDDVADYLVQESLAEIQKLIDPWKDASSALSYAITIKGKHRLSCNDKYVQSFLSSPSDVQLANEKQVTPIFLWGRVLAPEDQVNFFNMLVEASFALRAQSGECCLVAKCLSATGTEFLGLVRYRIFFSDLGVASTFSVVSIPPTKYIQQPSLPQPAHHVPTSSSSASSNSNSAPQQQRETAPAPPPAPSSSFPSPHTGPASAPPSSDSYHPPPSATSALLTAASSANGSAPWGPPGALAAVSRRPPPGPTEAVRAVPPPPPCTGPSALSLAAQQHMMHQQQQQQAASSAGPPRFHPASLGPSPRHPPAMLMGGGGMPQGPPEYLLPPHGQHPDHLSRAYAPGMLAPPQQPQGLPPPTFSRQPQQWRDDVMAGRIMGNRGPPGPSMW